MLYDVTRLPLRLLVITTLPKRNKILKLKKKKKSLGHLFLIVTR